MDVRICEAIRSYWGVLLVVACCRYRYPGLRAIALELGTLALGLSQKKKSYTLTLFPTETLCPAFSF
jgi:hypothetical protein